MDDKGPYWFNPGPLMRFKSRKERDVFKKKVKIAIAKLGYTSIPEFLRHLFIVLSETIPENHVEVQEITEEKKATLKELIMKILR